MLARKPAYPTTIKRYTSAYITKNNRLLQQYTDNKSHTTKCPSKKAQEDASDNDLIVSRPHVSYLSK